MKKLFKYFLFVMIAITAVACSKDDNGDSEAADLVGTWVCKDFDEGVSFTMCFKSNGTGWMEWSDEDDLDSFRYAATESKIYFTDDESSWSCEYKIKGNTLTIYGNPWGEDDDVNVLTLTRK